MKECPKCGNVYTDQTLSFCLADGTPLVSRPPTDAETEQFSNLRVDIGTAETSGKKTERTNLPTEETFVRTDDRDRKTGGGPAWIAATIGLLGLLLIGVFTVWLFSDRIFGESDTARTENADANAQRGMTNLAVENEDRNEKKIPDGAPTPVIIIKTQPPANVNPPAEPSPVESETPSADPYKVINVQSGDVLYLRPQPGYLKSDTGSIPPNGTGIIITGNSRKVGKSVWVPVNYNGMTGWVNRYYITRE
jgi:hypothetical protein